MRDETAHGEAAHTPRELVHLRRQGDVGSVSSRECPPGVERLAFLVLQLNHSLLYLGTNTDVGDLQVLQGLREVIEAIEPAYEVALIEMEKAARRD